MLVRNTTSYLAAMKMPRYFCFGDQNFVFLIILEAFFGMPDSGRRTHVGSGKVHQISGKTGTVDRRPVALKKIPQVSREFANTRGYHTRRSRKKGQQSPKVLLELHKKRFIAPPKKQIDFFRPNPGFHLKGWAFITSKNC
jgi:hypothetical protein